MSQETFKKDDVVEWDMEFNTFVFEQNSFLEKYGPGPFTIFWTIMAPNKEKAGHHQLVGIQTNIGSEAFSGAWFKKAAGDRNNVSREIFAAGDRVVLDQERAAKDADGHRMQKEFGDQELLVSSVENTEGGVVDHPQMLRIKGFSGLISGSYFKKVASPAS